MFQEDTVQPMVSITTSDLGEVKTIPHVASKLTVQLTQGFWQRPLNKLKKKIGSVLKFNPADMGATLPPVTHQVWKQLSRALAERGMLGDSIELYPCLWLFRLFCPCPDFYHHCDLAAYRDVSIRVKPSSIIHKPPNLRRVNPSLLKPCSALSARQNRLSLLRSEKLK